MKHDQFRAFLIVAPSLPYIRTMRVIGGARVDVLRRDGKDVIYHLYKREALAIFIQKCVSISAVWFVFVYTIAGQEFQLTRFVW